MSTVHAIIAIVVYIIQQGFDLGDRVLLYYICYY